MNRDRLLRAAGAYAEEIAHHLGGLTLQAAVLAGLRLRDGNKYTPDDRLVPSRPDRLFAELRRLWLEYEQLGRSLGGHLEERDRIELRLRRMAETASWHDDLALAALAAELCPADPLARITLAASALRAGRLELADRAIAGLGRGLPPRTLARLYRNRAGLEERRGDDRLALRFARHAVQVDPACPLSRSDLLAYGAKLLAAPSHT